MISRALLAFAPLLVSCKGCDAGNATAVDAAPPSPSAVVVEAAAPVVDAAPLPSAVAASTTEAEPADAGASPCRVSYGPAEQSFRGPAALSVVGNELRLIANDSGKPRIYPVPIPTGATPVVPPRPLSFVGMRWPACEIAGTFVYCQGPGGMIVRSQPGGQPKQIAKSRPGTRIAAAPIGTDHAAVAYLDLRRTTEGDMLQAFVVLDDGDPVRISDDGAGATTVSFLPRGDEPVALYLDVRTAMVPVHARPVHRKPDGGLALGTDAVVFVGGAPERGIDFTTALAGDQAYAFVPMPRDTLEFGMATLPIASPPKDDVPAIWSLYPNGIDPAPIAAAPARDGKGAWIARVRPRQKEPGSPRIVELGRVDIAGVFTSYGEIAPARAVTDLALIEDAGGGVWVSYGDTTSTWLERRLCTVSTAASTSNKNGVFPGPTR